MSAFANVSSFAAVQSVRGAVCARPPRVGRARTAPKMSAPGVVGEKAQALVDFLNAAGDLGTMRFVNMSEGCIMETLGRFDYGMQYNDVRGGLLTLASPDKLFEMHLMLATIDKITLTKEKAKVGDHDIYVVRFLGGDGKPRLSALLMWNPSEGPGSYFPGTVEKFTALQARYPGGELILPA